MKNLKAFLTFLFLTVALATLHAQDTYDIIYLKNGSIYKGAVTEYIPDNHAVIKLLDGRIITVEAADIGSMNIADTEIIKKQFNIKSKGYFHNSMVGPQFGKTEYNGFQPTFSYNMINGYKLNRHHPGIGLGIEKYAGNWYMPLYADYSYHFLNKRFSPLVGVNAGWMIPLQSDSNANGYDRYNYQKGAFVGGRIGFVAYNNPHFAFQLNITYRYVHLADAEYGYGYFLMEDNNLFTGSADLHRVGVMLGFVFN